MGVTKLFQDKNQYGSGVSQEVCRHDKEPYISTYLETGDEPVEKDSLESQIGNIQAQALDKQPCHRRQTEPVLPEIAIIPMMIRPNRTDNAFRLSFTKTIKPNIPRIINVTTLSIWAKSQGE